MLTFRLFCKARNNSPNQLSSSFKGQILWERLKGGAAVLLLFLLLNDTNVTHAIASRALDFSQGRRSLCKALTERESLLRVARLKCDNRVGECGRSLCGSMDSHLVSATGRVHSHVGTTMLKLLEERSQALQHSVAWTEGTATGYRDCLLRVSTSRCRSDLRMREREKPSDREWDRAGSREKGEGHRRTELGKGNKVQGQRCGTCCQF